MNEGNMQPGMVKESGKQSMWIAAVIIIAILGIGFFILADKKDNLEDSALMEGGDQMMKEGEAMMEGAITVSMKAENGSKQDGTVTIVDENGKVKVIVKVASGAKDIAQPAHIHTGSCPSPSPAPTGVAYALNNVVNGTSETTLTIGTKELLARLPLSILIHKSAAEAKTYVSCGDIADSTMMKDGGAMMEKKHVLVTYTDTGFVPATLTINAGETVTFMNESGSDMWVASAIHPTHEILPEFDQMKGTPKGTSYSFTFTKAGDWKFHDHFNPSARGTITVK